MMLALAWKDCREHRAVWIAMLALNLMAVLGLPMAFATPGAAQLGPAELQIVLAAALGSAGVYGLVCGSMMLASEHEGGTIGFLDSLSGRRAGVWWVKLLTGLALTLGLSLLAGMAAALFGPSDEYVWPAGRWLIALPAVAIDAFLWGMLGSAFCRSTMAAVGCAAAFLVVTWTFTGAAIFAPDAMWYGVGARIVVGVVALAISAAAFCRSDISRAPIPTAPRSVTRFLYFPGNWRSLQWLLYRQARWEVLVLGIVASIIGIFVPADYLAVWAIGSLFLGVIAGTGVFSAEQRGGYQRFLADQRLPIGRIWWFKLLFWALILVFFGFLLGTGTLAMTARQEWLHGSSSGGPFRGEHESLRMMIVVCGFGMLATIWPLMGFAIGQFFSFVFRKGVVAVVFSLIVAIGVVAVWTPSLLAGGLTWWQMLGVPIILIAGTRLVVWAWATERLQTARPALVLSGCVLLTVWWTCGVFAYRAIEVPDVGEPFDVAAYQASLQKYEKSKAAEFLANACRRIKQATEEADKEIGPPAQAVLQPRNGPIPAEIPKAVTGMMYMQYVNNIMSGDSDYPKQSVELDRWMDRMFADEWVRDLRAGLAEPPGLMVDPRRTIDFYSPSMQYFFSALPTIYALLPTRAYQLLARGDQAGAFDQIIEMLALARCLSRNPGVLRHYGRALESSALTVLDRWLAEAGDRDLLGRALEAVRAHQRELPSAEDTSKAEYLIARNRLDNSAVAFIDSAAGRSYAERHPQIQARMHVLGLSLQMPWEKERARRMLNVIYAGRLQALQKGYPAAMDAIYGDRRSFPGGRLLLYDWVVPEKASISPEAFAELVNHSWLWVFGDVASWRMIQLEATSQCKIAASQLQIALVLHELEQGKVAQSLNELVPRYLPKLLVDPFSGKGFRYRVSQGESLLWRPLQALDPDAHVDIPAGEGILWSTGPDRQDSGGLVRGNEHGHDASQRAAAWDWLFRVPRVKKKL